MPKEKSIPKRLSGSEALDSLLHQVQRRLLEDFKDKPSELDDLLRKIYARMCMHGHFHSHKAYQGYAATVKLVFLGYKEGNPPQSCYVQVEFKPAMSFAPPLTDDFMVEVGDLIPQGIYPKYKIEIPVRPPNAVRKDAGLDLPIQVEENGQMVEKFVPAARYKSKLNPGQELPKTYNASIPTMPGKFEVPDDLVESLGIQTR